MFKGCVFDLDGVITDTAKLHFAAWKRLSKEQLNIDLPDSFEVTLKGVGRIDSLKKILSFGKLEEKINDKQIDELAFKKNSYYLESINNLTEQDILPGISKFIDQLRKHNILMSIASASKNAPIILKKLNLIDNFNAIVDPAKIKRGKPAPDIFIEGALKLGLRPDECIGIEDSVAGVQSIKDAGMICVAIGNEKELL